METVLLHLLAAVVTLALIAGGIALAVRESRRVAARFRALAQQLGLAVVDPPAGPTGWGKLPEAQGRLSRLFRYTTGVGKSRTEWTALAVTPVQSSGLTFRLSPQGIGSGFLQLFGAREIELGDPLFDERWFIQTNAPDYLRAALVPELRSRLLAGMAQGGRGSYETVDGTVRYVEQGALNEARSERFATVADVVSDLAGVIEVYAGHAQRR